MILAERVKDISSFIVMDVLERAQELEKQGKKVIHLEVGEPDFDTPACIKDSLCKAIKDGYTHYTQSLGDIELREAIAQHYYKEYSVDISPEQIIVTSGTSPAIYLLLSTLINKNEEVILSNPGYACYKNFIKIVEGKPVEINVYEDDGFQLRAEDIQKKISPKTKAILINSPMNPTGNLLSSDRLKSIAGLGAYIISDEIYHGLTYKGKAHSILEYTDEAFVLNGFSKLYAMTGLRLGFLIAPKKYIRILQKVQQNLFISANSAVQRAAITALTEAKSDIENMVDTYDRRRKYIINRLADIGLSIPTEPTGAFYAFTNVKKYTSNSYQLAFDILEKTHVGVTPGIDFGTNGEGYLRFSYANSLENIEEGLERLAIYFSKLNRTC